ncbi:hypothetical protein GCM10010976_20330 [Bizionia arctica]|uniref:Uncharacterized protein n=1 Tax=Bizionia arctica TaxID=1495645 RepID=A0A917GK57_9FLAO|nr:hypothetical protein GCM10010976_20330 [Bizionia arctica]
MELLKDITINLLSDLISFLIGALLFYMFASLKKAKKVIYYITNPFLKKPVLAQNWHNFNN